jgi:hypothetical protein
MHSEPYLPYLNDFPKNQSKPKLQSICFPFEQTVAFLGSFQSGLHQRLGSSNTEISIYKYCYET